MFIYTCSPFKVVSTCALLIAGEQTGQNGGPFRLDFQVQRSEVEFARLGQVQSLQRRNSPGWTGTEYRGGIHQAESGTEYSGGIHQAESGTE